ncbi:MAG: CDP-alcohol phosphatidyltransferase family protein [Alphaproteobacteria bacterium]
MSQRFADWLIAHGKTANEISVAGLAFAVVAGACFVATAWATASPWLWLLGALLVQFRLLANMLDGMVALATETQSRLGEIFNEVPDRLADIAVLVGLGYAHGGTPWLGWAAALAAVLTAYLRIAGVAAGAPADFRGPMAKPHRMFTVTAGAVLCAASAFTHHDYAGVVWGMGVPTLILIVIGAGSLVTAWRRGVRLFQVLR